MAAPEKLKQSLPGIFRISKYFWPHVRQYRGLIAMSMLALFAEVLLRLLEPWPLKFVFDRVIHTGQPRRRWLLPPVDNFDPLTLAAFAAIAVVVITGLRALASYWQTIGLAQI